MARAFETARVAHYLCGSMASSAQGVPRASADVDFVADLIGVLQVQAGRLDLAYMRRWATNIGVAELLERALAAS